jgi:dienelactone hydrolase
VRYLECSLAVLFGTTSLAAAQGPAPAAAASPFRTPQEVWAGFDPRREPLDVQIKAAWVEKGIAYREFCFTGETFANTPVRVYAMYAAPQGGKDLPAVLHIHGGGGTVSRPWLDLWANRGYAALSFNWGGRWEKRPDYTRWGPLVQGNHLDANPGVVVVRPDQHVSCWYHWAVISRRCLTYLERQPEVDARRIGIFGISMGGTLAWPIAAMDQRVKAACAIYGNGWDTYPQDRYAPDPRAADPDTLVWRKTMEAESYAPLIRCPVLFLSATDDQHGRMDRSDDILARVPAPTWQANTPNQRHHVAPEQGKDLPLFMDAMLKGGPAWPKNPAVRLALAAGGVPALAVAPDAAPTVQRVEIYYGIGQTHPMARHWRLVAASRCGDAWQADLPVLDVRQKLFAFANVFYGSGICLTSRLIAAVPAELGDAKATDRPSLLIDDFSAGIAAWVRSPAYTDPWETTTYLRPAVGPRGQKGITQANTGNWYVFCTRKIGDPKWRGPAGAALVFQVLSGKANQLKVAVIRGEGRPEAKTFVARADLAPSADWQNVTLKADRFKTAEGQVLGGWQDLNCLQITADAWAGDPCVLSLVRWLP